MLQNLTNRMNLLCHSECTTSCQAFLKQFNSDPEVGLVLLPDIKWDQKDEQNLYMLGVVKKRGVPSLRDLIGEHQC